MLHSNYVLTTLNSFIAYFFLLAQYPNFDATDDNDVIVLSLIVFHGLWVKSSEPFVVHASQMNNGNKTIIMDFLLQAEKYQEKLSVIFFCRVSADRTADSNRQFT